MPKLTLTKRDYVGDCDLCPHGRQTEVWGYNDDSGDLLCRDCATRDDGETA